MRTHWLLAGAVVAVLATSARGSDFQDTRYGYALSPPDFTTPAPGTQAIRMTVSAPARAGFAPNLNVMVQEVRTTREEYVARSEKEFAAAGMTLRTSTKRDVSGRPAVLMDYEGPMGGLRLRFLSLAVVLPDRVLLVTCTAPAASFAEMEGDFRRSLDSFRLTAR